MGKKHFIGTAAAGVAVLLLSFSGACTDGRDEGFPPGERIGFAVDLWKEGGAAQAALTKGAGAEAGSLPADTLPAVQVIPLEGEASGDGKPLYLHAVTTDGIGDDTAGQDIDAYATTKAAPVITATMYDEMAVTAFVYPASDSWPSAYTGGSTESYMRTVRVKKSESWSTSYYWPGAARRISFFASAPYGSAGLTAFNDGTSGNPPYLSYTVPADVADQKDLLVAASTDRPGNTNTAEALTMKHALTGVRFVTGDNMLPGTVSKITLKNVYGTGSLPMTASPAWHDQGGARNFELTLSPAATAPDPPAPGTPLTPTAATFMMLSQTLPAGAQIEVKYKDKLTDTQRTLTANIAGKTWPMGKTVTYRISTSSIVITSTLEVTPPADYTYQGGNGSYTVKSYASVSGGGSTANVPIAWEVEYSEDGVSWNSTKPAWLTAFTESGAGGTSPSTYTATVAAQVNSAPADPHNEALKNAAPVNDGTNANIYDLSTHDYQGNLVPMRTANCYIVNAAGRYKLPLVYGNAVDYVKVPATGKNTSAYIAGASGSNILSPFINHLGAGITDPYIYNNTNCTPASCTLVWQDEPNLVTDVALSSDRHFLEFTVGQATIKQGNAVVAVRDASNTILWSWHIWVTDYKPGITGTTTPDKEITNHQGVQYKIMAFNLGWCDGKEETYAERTVQVRFRQIGTTAQQTITVKQKAHTIAELGNNTYYQWGRKDPFVGALENPDGSLNSINKTWYDALGTSHTDERPPTGNFSYEDACITSGITRPNTFCTNYYMDNRYYNLWSANNTVYTGNDNPVVKTIYDPCPAGYTMPPSNVFTGFTTTGQYTSDPSQFNVQGPWNKGWNFHCGLNHTGSTVFFPASGYRNSNSAVPYYVGSLAFYWAAGPNYTGYGRCLYFNPGNVYPLDNSNRSVGFGVRAAQE
ncbi:fimbrillin family protein [Bacteroides zoogleoformans]|uniref:Fimbrillin family protein n=1 Tax=Bacteroides zoogleoformans TaxID=28119 RepID=A0ABM6T9D5_9BACE|nr:fimbrillin family protein [Bacteroides zoogleoformans]AVM53423.1 fimbrillin family protein [Bacteroides zoogleoformans]